MERCERQSRGGREGGGGPGGWSDGPRSPAGRRLAGGLAGWLQQPPVQTRRAAERSGAMASGECSQHRGPVLDLGGKELILASCCSVSGAQF